MVVEPNYPSKGPPERTNVLVRHGIARRLIRYIRLLHSKDYNVPLQ